MLATVPRKLWTSGEGGVKYKLRIETLKDRKATLQNKDVGVNIALVNTDGGILMHRVVPTMVGVRGGVGDVDTVEFYGLDIGTVSQVWLSPEEGQWGVEEIWLEGDYQKARFLRDRDLDGTRGREEFGVLFTHVPLSLELDVAKHAEGMVVYERMKNDIMFRTAGLAGLGAFVLYLQGNDALVGPFAGGAGMGLIYQRMLQHEVDGVGKKRNLFWSVYAVLNTMLARVGVVFIAMYTLLQQAGGGDMDMVWGVVVGGFLLNKIALWSVMAEGPEKN